MFLCNQDEVAAPRAAPPRSRVKALLLLPGDPDHDALSADFAADGDLVIVGHHRRTGRFDSDAFLMRLVGSDLEIFSDGFESGTTSAWSP